MTDLAVETRAPRVSLRTRLNRLAVSPKFQRWAARVPVLRGRVSAEGAALFDVVQGFVASQALMAIVTLDLPEKLLDGPETVANLAASCGLTEARMTLLLQAGAALGLFKRRRDGRFDLTLRGAALNGAPGLRQMIRHHSILYRDLADPVALLRGETDTELARFWPYVFGAGAAEDPAQAALYSELMADSQLLVADDTLAAVDLKGVRHLLDVGGGLGSFARAAAAEQPDLRVTLFDLPAVAEAASERLDRDGMSDRISVVPGSFRDDPLPQGADAISLIRVLYDHGDETVAALLAKCHAALPPGGRLIVSEPMSGGVAPERAGDVYFAFYTLAMRTGTVRSAERIEALLRTAGFTGIRTHASARPFITTAMSAKRA